MSFFEPPELVVAIQSYVVKPRDDRTTGKRNVSAPMHDANKSSRTVKVAEDLGTEAFRC